MPIQDTNRFYYKIILSYKGTRYVGWQFQTVNPETIQNYVQKVLANIVNHQEIQVIGASRTDNGVHASGQVLKVILPENISPDKLLLGMNSKLPKDIRVVNCDVIDESFNVNKDVKSKEYHYYFIQNKNQNAALAETIHYISEEQVLDMQLIREACQVLKGEHDFLGFCVMGAKEVRTVRNITHCSIETTSFLPFEAEIFYLNIQASGFLKYMVRFIMGALIDIGFKKLSIADFKHSLQTGNPYTSKKKVPANGLHLIKIEY